MSYETLLSPMNIGNLQIKNRVVMTAAEMGMADMDGAANEKVIRYYEERAKGGVGLIITGTTRVNDWDSASTFTQLAMSHDYHIAPMRNMVERIHSHGAKLAVQLHHAGRQGYAVSNNNLPMLLPLVKRVPQAKKAIFGMTPVLNSLAEKGFMAVTAPSKCEPSYHVPSKMRALTTKQVENLVQDFVKAAVRCKEAGVDAVELHGAHGYLIQQFLSPNTNLRSDKYGGTLKNRMRFLMEIIRGIQWECGKDYPIIVRLTVDEMYDRIGKAGKGYDLFTGKKMAKLLEEAGISAIDVTSAGYDAYNYWLEPTTFEPGWRAYLAKEIKSVVSIPVIAANFIRSPEQAEEQLANGTQDFIGSARSFICDPHWVKKIEEGRPEQIRRCIGCLGCMESMTANAFKGTNGECALNPYVGREELMELPQDGNGRLVLVIGAGVAGLTVAETMARRGFSVRVLEREKEAGGQVNIAAKCLLHEKLKWSVDNLLEVVKSLGVQIEYGVEATEETVRGLAPYAVFVATGAVPIRPRSIKGVDLPHVCTAPDVILGKTQLAGKAVAVIGSGMTGLETAELLEKQGNRVTIVEMANEVAPGAWFQNVDDEMSRINNTDIKIVTGARLLAIRENEILAEDVKTGELKHFPAEAVVLSLGVRPENRLCIKLEDTIPNVFPVGDAVHSGRIGAAVKNAFETAMNLK